MFGFRKIILLTMLSFFCFSVVSAQSAVVVSGCNATGSEASVTYSIGQLFYNIYTGTDGSELQGVQQPFEITVFTSVENFENIIPGFIAYPNPAANSVTLCIEPYNYEKMRFQLIDMFGTVIQDKNIEEARTIISMENLTGAIYLIEIFVENQKVKVFKIIKN